VMTTGRAGRRAGSADDELTAGTNSITVDKTTDATSGALTIRSGTTTITAVADSIARR
jgi:hypothetical protein